MFVTNDYSTTAQVNCSFPRSGLDGFEPPECSFLNNSLVLKQVNGHLGGKLEIFFHSGEQFCAIRKKAAKTMGWIAKNQFSGAGGSKIEQLFIKLVRLGR